MSDFEKAMPIMKRLTLCCHIWGSGKAKDLKAKKSGSLQHVALF